eukprot:5108952-Amphidinium_carterae.1
MDPKVYLTLWTSRLPPTRGSWTPFNTLSDSHNSSGPPGFGPSCAIEAGQGPPGPKSNTARWSQDADRADCQQHL